MNSESIENNLFLKFIGTKNEIVFKELYKLITPRLYNFIYRIVPDKLLVEDIIQETWIVAINKGNVFNNEKGNFRSYVYKIAINNSYKLIRRNKVKKAFLEKTFINQNEQILESHDNKMEINEKNNALIAAIAKLPEKLKQALSLYYFAELDIKEIANQLSLPENTVKTHLSRARQQLEQILKSKKYSFYFKELIKIFILSFNI